MLEEEHSYRALMQESLTALAIMTVDTEDSRSVRRPWGLLKLQQLSPNAKRKAIHIVLDRLFVWVPVQCGIDIVRHQQIWGQSRTRYRAPKDTDGLGEGFYLYCVNGSKAVTVFYDLRPCFPSIGHLFCTGALSVTIPQCHCCSSLLEGAIG